MKTTGSSHSAAGTRGLQRRTIAVCCDEGHLLLSGHGTAKCLTRPRVRVACRSPLKRTAITPPPQTRFADKYTNASGVVQAILRASARRSGGEREGRILVVVQKATVCESSLRGTLLVGWSPTYVSYLHLTFVCVRFEKADKCLANPHDKLTPYGGYDGTVKQVMRLHLTIAISWKWSHPKTTHEQPLTWMK